jgi:hypothetical protein
MAKSFTEPWDDDAGPPRRGELDDSRARHRAFGADSPELKAGGSRLFGLQTWVALSAAHEETNPPFAHYEETDLPLP